MDVNDLSDYRKNYTKKELLEKDCLKDPVRMFDRWFTEADRDDSVEEANAMTLSTVGDSGFPLNRVVLLKKYSDKGFVFFTNYTSRKGKDILYNPKVCLSFFWPVLERQIIIRGEVSKIDEADSDTYFDSRPFESRLGALSSEQSKIISSREEIEAKLNDLKKIYLNETISRPKTWGGFIVKPVSFEFWQGRSNRLHDRILYNFNNNHTWDFVRLSP